MAGPSPGQLKGIDHDCNDIPDAAMTLAVAALFAAGPTSIRNVYNWRVKETERMVAIVTELRKLGAQVPRRRLSLATSPPCNPGCCDAHVLLAACGVGPAQRMPGDLTGQGYPAAAVLLCSPVLQARND
jgi:3-phosphoshikimate 1-carboxyvinyltransferase